MSKEQGTLLDTRSVINAEETQGTDQWRSGGGFKFNSGGPAA